MSVEDVGTSFLSDLSLVTTLGAGASFFGREEKGFFKQLFIGPFPMLMPLEVLVGTNFSSLLWAVVGNLILKTNGDFFSTPFMPLEGVGTGFWSSALSFDDFARLFSFVEGWRQFYVQVVCFHLSLKIARLVFRIKLPPALNKGKKPCKVIKPHGHKIA
jgi:hypothetical protein